MMTESEKKELKETIMRLDNDRIDWAINQLRVGAEWANEESAEHDSVDEAIRILFPANYESIVCRLPNYYEWDGLNEEERADYGEYADYCNDCYNRCGRFFDVVADVIEQLKGEK